MNRRFVGKIMQWTLVSLTCVVLALVCIMPGHEAQAALTKTTAFDTIDAWQSLAVSTVAVGNAEDLSGSYSTVIYIEVALTHANAQAGVDVMVEVSYADDDWIAWWGPFTGTAETPGTTTLAVEEAAGQTVLSLTDAATADFDEPLRKWFIIDGTVANSESVRTRSVSGNDVTVCQDTMRLHANASNVWDRVDEWICVIPFAVSYARVIVYNSDADATIHWRSYCSKVTSMN